MANLTTLTAKQLADKLFELTGKSLKPSSYSKAKFIAMIEAAETIKDVQENPLPSFAKNLDKALVAAKSKEIEKIEETDISDFTNCPHCGVHHSNGFCTNEDIIDQGGEPNKTHQYVCLGCGGEFGPELEEEFTMTEAAAAAGVSPKVARARYRAVSNDNQRTFYRFPRSQWDAVLTIISPKRKAR